MTLGAFMRGSMKLFIEKPHDGIKLIRRKYISISEVISLSYMR
jgi:hypothetical protein